MTEEALSPYEKDILERIREAEIQIDNWVRQKAILQDMLIRAKNSGITEVLRKNSGERVAIEKRVRDALDRRSSKIATLDDLYKDAKSMYPELKKETFRLYIHRMKKKEIIKTAGYALWQLVEKKSN